MRPPARLARALLPGLALAGVAAAACAGGPPPPRTVPAGGEPPWRVPAAAYGTQRLYRAGYSGPEGEGSFRLTLRLAAPDRYQVQAVDPVGRALWSLDVDGRRGLWLDHRAQVACSFDGRFEVAGLPLASIPLSALPALLLERLPEEPADEPRWEGNRVSYRDASGRRWTAVVGEGGVESWTVADEAGPAAWWTRRESWSVLSDRRRQAQVRWREVLREELGDLEGLGARGDAGAARAAARVSARRLRRGRRPGARGAGSRRPADLTRSAPLSSIERSRGRETAVLRASGVESSLGCPPRI